MPRSVTSSEPKNVRKLIMLQPSVAAKLKDQASGQGLSVNETVNRAIENYLKNDSGYVEEGRNKPVQLLLRASTMTEIEARASALGISVNEAITQAILSYLES